MTRIFQLIFWVLVFTSFPAVTSAQEKLVKVNSIKIDGKPVKVKYEIDLITDKTITKAKTNNAGFFVPADLLANETIGVVVRLKNYVLVFESVYVSNFNTDWVVGIDTEPFEKEKLGTADPATTKLIYYLHFGGEPERELTVVESKPKLIRRS